jgi:SAM-dependent methyltransferase
MKDVERPFYHRLAWAYDLLVDDPVEPWIDAVEALSGGVPAMILDAGCGTGRHAVALAARGHIVTGVDASEDLLQIAVARAQQANVPARFVRADLRRLDLGFRFSVVACRGVLNDMVEDRDRDATLEGFARHLGGGGALILDVRDRDATATRYSRHPGERRSVVVEGGELVFTWRGRFEPDTGCLRVDEAHHLLTGKGEHVVRHMLVMRCWTPAELNDRLSRAGFQRITVRPGFRRAAADRIVATARRPG